MPTSAADLRYGRQRWTRGTVAVAVPCDVCGRPSYFAARHLECHPPVAEVLGQLILGLTTGAPAAAAGLELGGHGADHAQHGEGADQGAEHERAGDGEVRPVHRRGHGGLLEGGEAGVEGGDLGGHRLQE